MPTWTLDTRIELTPVGRYVADLKKADRELDALTYPGFQSQDNRVKRLALKAMHAANRLQGHIREELRRFEALPALEDDEEIEGISDPDRCICGAEATTDYFGSRFCERCAGVMLRMDEQERNFSDGRGECCR